jgi:hypothetical protein
MNQKADEYIQNIPATGFLPKNLYQTLTDTFEAGQIAANKEWLRAIKVYAEQNNVSSHELIDKLYDILDY